MRLVFWGFSGLAGSMRNSFYLHAGEARSKKRTRGKESSGGVVCTLETTDRIDAAA